MLIMNWVLYSMEEDIAKRFKYCDTTKELWESMRLHLKKRNNAKILELTKEIAASKQGDLSVGNYYSKFRAFWCELEAYRPLELSVRKNKQSSLKSNTYLNS